LIYKKDAEQYRWYRCRNLLYNYAFENNTSIEKIKNIINVLSSDEEKNNKTLFEYWKQYWNTKSVEAQTQAQKESARNNLYRANQLTFDAKFAQRIADGLDERKIGNFTIENIVNGKLKLQGSPIDIPKENALQGFRKYYTMDYEEIYNEIWKPFDETIPETYNLPPYLLENYKILGPSMDLIHSYRIQTHSYFDFVTSFVPLSFMLTGKDRNDFGSGYGLFIKPRLNFSAVRSLYDKEYLLLSHNSFKEILDIKERNDIERIYYQSEIFWDIITNFGFIYYPSKSDNRYFQNYFISQGFGINYRYDEDIVLTFNLYYLSFNYQKISSSFSFSNGILYYFVSPEFEMEINFKNLLLKPSIQYIYQFKGDQRISNISFGLGVGFIFGEEQRFSF
jgi:hypothetical protein